MQTAGFVLAGGASSRMGRNKAFLMQGGRTLIEIAADAVRQAAGSVTIIGSPEVFQEFALPVIPDRRPGCGPLAGIETALFHTTADWNLIVACDMPRLDPQVLGRILAEAQARPDVICVLPESAAGRVEPLCAVYRRTALSIISNSLNNGVRKVREALEGSPVYRLHMANDPVFQNVNTPEEWQQYHLNNNT